MPDDAERRLLERGLVERGPRSSSPGRRTRPAARAPASSSAAATMSSRVSPASGVRDVVPPRRVRLLEQPDQRPASDALPRRSPGRAAPSSSSKRPRSSRYSNATYAAQPSESDVQSRFVPVDDPTPRASAPSPSGCARMAPCRRRDHALRARRPSGRSGSSWRSSVETPPLGRRRVEQLGDPLRPVAGIPVLADEVRVLGVDRGVVGGHDHPARRVELPRQVLERDRARPVVLPVAARRGSDRRGPSASARIGMRPGRT